MDSITGFFHKEKPVPAANDDVFETIKKLTELKEMDVITQEEVDAKKEELLAKI